MCSLHSFIFAVLPLYIIGERHSTSVVTYDVFAAARTPEIPIERLSICTKGFKKMGLGRD